MITINNKVRSFLNLDRFLFTSFEEIYIPINSILIERTNNIFIIIF